MRKKKRFRNPHLRKKMTQRKYERERGQIKRKLENVPKTSIERTKKGKKVT